MRAVTFVCAAIAALFWGCQISFALNVPSSTRLRTVRRTNFKLKCFMLEEARAALATAESKLDSARKMLQSIQPQSIPQWQIEEDTSDIEVSSSEDIKLKKEIQKLEIEVAEATETFEKAKRIFETRAAETKSRKQTIPTPAKPPAPTEAPPTAPGIIAKSTKEERTAFDAGLIILFPIMIGTLLLFLFFPVIGQQLSSSLPSPPTS